MQQESTHLLVTQDNLNELHAKLDAIRGLVENLKKAPVIQQEYLSVSEAAEVVGVEEKFIRQAKDEGELNYYDISLEGAGRATIRIRRADLDDWLESKRKRQAPGKAECDELADRYFGKAA